MELCISKYQGDKSGVREEVILVTQLNALRCINNKKMYRFSRKKKKVRVPLLYQAKKKKTGQKGCFILCGKAVLIVAIPLANLFFIP